MRVVVYLKHSQVRRGLLWLSLRHRRLRCNALLLTAAELCTKGGNRRHTRASCWRRAVGQRCAANKGAPLRKLCLGNTLNHELAAAIDVDAEPGPQKVRGKNIHLSARCDRVAIHEAVR